MQQREMQGVRGGGGGGGVWCGGTPGGVSAGQQRLGHAERRARRVRGARVLQRVLAVAAHETRVTRGPRECAVRCRPLPLTLSILVLATLRLLSLLLNYLLINIYI